MYFSYYEVTVIALAGFLSVYTYQTISLWRRMKGAKPPPGPRGWPIVGNAPELASSNGHLVGTFKKWTKEYGDVVQFSILGEKQVIVSSDKIAHDLMVKRGAIYSDRGTPYAAARILHLNPAIRTNDDSWRKERRLITQAVSMSANNTYLAAMEAESKITLRDLLLDPENFDNNLSRYAFGVLTRSMLGFEVETANDPFIVETRKNIDEFLRGFRPDYYPINVFPFLRFFPAWLVPSNSEMEKMRKKVYDMIVTVRERVKASVNDGTAGTSMYRHFFEHRDEYDITDDEAGYAFDSMISAGTASPHNALLTFLYLMMEYPEWQKKIQREVDQVVGPDRLPCFEDIPNLPLVRAIVKEGIRYRTIVAELGIPHRLEKDDIYKEYFFEKNTVFHAYYGAILMDQDMYPDQMLFNPDRWLDPIYPTYKEPLTIHPNLQNYTPFGYGRRACPGWDFSERTITILVAQMAWGCEIRKPLDPITNKPIEIVLLHEPTPNPKPLPFPCDIRPRSAEKVRIVSGGE
ncbi:cytochrome P450 oxidoreductase [Fusarium austroafricanum]|uniref:Cytochrome P450 oxidoreductase n=1 Tax=Fusarium austroafricanum TaxID=2364996 RepID=A0A8H4NMN5_9HYPO|nr:cytochrome P450 oxidoreductase [Fusarium austroafricanum]